jgi:hypothetical protein
MLQEYKCTKIVEAKPMDKDTANHNGLIRDAYEGNEEGYHVVYGDDYESWSPKKAFEEGYELLKLSSEED